MLNLAWSVISPPDDIATGWQSIALRPGAAALAVILLWRLLPQRHLPIENGNGM